MTQRITLAKRILALAAIMFCITALAGCEGTPIDSSADKHTEAVTQSECSTYNAQWETCTITMPDSRRVTCIAHNSNAGIHREYERRHHAWALTSHGADRAAQRLISRIKRQNQRDEHPREYTIE